MEWHWSENQNDWQCTYFYRYPAFILRKTQVDSRWEPTKGVLIVPQGARYLEAPDGQRDAIMTLDPFQNRLVKAWKPLFGDPRHRLLRLPIFRILIFYNRDEYSYTPIQQGRYMEVVGVPTGNIGETQSQLENEFWSRQCP